MAKFRTSVVRQLEDEQAKLTPLSTEVFSYLEGFMKTPQFVQESFDIALRQRTLGNGKHLAFGPTSWQHNLPPVGGVGLRKQIMR
ncbi:MAG TPA: hypothetical protein VGC99_08935 [Candidatus Tectomicrobia bacterium]